jgi:hypothetical protein
MLPIAVAAGAALLLWNLSKPRSRRRAKARPVYVEPEWQIAERTVCKARKRQHKGGPGKADCSKTIEVKHWGRPVDSGTVRREHAKGRREIVATSGNGFTKPARRVAKKLRVRLRHV